MARAQLFGCLCMFIVAGVSAASIQIQSPYSWACSTSGSNTQLKGCADSSCNPIQANIGGMVLVLSTASMLRTPAGNEALGATPAECCNLCKNTDMCNAWVFCNKKEGCGSPGSCTAYMASLSPMSMTNSMQGLMPAAGFGQFSAGCNTDGRWAYRTCSLKQVANVLNPPAWGLGTDAEGWTAGVTPKPASNIQGCPNGFTDYTCKTCAASRNPTLCYTCMQGSTSWRAGAAQCAACANGGRCQGTAV